MVELEWDSDGRFVDRDRDIEVANDPDEDENTTYDVPDDAVEEYLDRPGWVRPDKDTDEIDELLEGTNDEVTDALATGDYDDQLEEVEDRADRQGVQDAVDDRRDELEDEG